VVVMGQASRPGNRSSCEYHTATGKVGHCDVACGTHRNLHRRPKQIVRSARERDGAIAAVPVSFVHGVHLVTGRTSAVETECPNNFVVNPFENEVVSRIEAGRKPLESPPSVRLFEYE